MNRRTRPIRGRSHSIAVITPIKASLLAILFVLLAVYPYPPLKAEATLIPVSVTIIKAIETDCDEGLGEKCPNDMFARVNIAPSVFGDNFEKSPLFGVNAAVVTPYWRTTPRLVDKALGTITIDIELNDDDDLSASDTIDISDGDDMLHLTVNLNTGEYSGEVTGQGIGFSQGTGQESAKIIFDIAVGSNGDIDDDGIPDGVERVGIKDDDGNVILNMAALGADPCRKTIAVEIDYMADAEHSHRPTDAAVAELVTAFDIAPVDAVTACPYPGFPRKPKGIDLIVIRDQQLPEQSNIDYPAAAQAVRDPNFDARRRPYFHYSLWVHGFTINGRSPGAQGVCCFEDAGGKDVLVSLGNKHRDPGFDREQSSIFMHELGHALGLDHGGGRELDAACDPETADCKFETNCKPNYLSIMNYAFLKGVIKANAANADRCVTSTIDNGSCKIDYSHSALPQLDETGLIEKDGVKDGDLITIWSPDGGPTWKSARAAGGPINWDNDDPPNTDETVAVDINDLDSPDFLVLFCEGSPGQVLDGYDDWHNLKYRGVLSAFATASFAYSGTENELDLETRQRISEKLAEALKPDPSITMTVSPNPVLTGANVAYTMTLRNRRVTPATDVRVSDSLPNLTTFAGCTSTGGVTCGASGNNVSVTYPTLLGDALQTITVLATVDCNVADGVSFSNTASVSSSSSDADPTNNAAIAHVVTSNPPPVIGNVSVDKPVVKPSPQHKMELITVNYTVEDNCGTPTITLSVSSNEPINGTDDGDTSPDWEIVDAHHVRLRAERSGTGTGRIYTIAITASDSVGNSSGATSTVRVPLSQGR
jgi:uncharacterized repeat protein (TIGR01451 family)